MAQLIPSLLITVLSIVVKQQTKNQVLRIRDISFQAPEEANHWYIGSSKTKDKGLDLDQGLDQGLAQGLDQELETRIGTKAQGIKTRTKLLLVEHFDSFHFCWAIKKRPLHKKDLPGSFEAPNLLFLSNANEVSTGPTCQFLSVCLFVCLCFQSFFSRLLIG